MSYDNNKNSFNNNREDNSDRPEEDDHGYSLYNKLYHQTTANIVMAVLERTYHAYGTRVFYDVIEPQTTSITFQTAVGNSDNSPAQGQKAINNFVQDMLAICNNEQDINLSNTEEVSNLTFQIRDVLPALRTLAAERFTNPKHQSLVCGIINDLQIELKRNDNPNAPQYNQ